MSVTINGSAGVTTNSGAVYNGISSGTAVSASGTSVDFTDIPSWVKRITVMCNGVSTNGTSSFLIQLGDSGGVENTGYSSGSHYISGGPSVAFSTAGYIINTFAQASTIHGQMIISCLDTSANSWVESGNFANTSGFCMYSSGSKSLSATLDRVRITTVNGTDTFDAGSINILYE